jgi:hypothetical protein
MSQEEVRKGMRPRGDGSGKGRGTGQQRKWADDDDDEEAKREFRAWLENRAMKTESALMQLAKMVGGLVQDMDILKKKERTQSQVLKKVEEDLAESRSEMTEGIWDVQVEVSESRRVLEEVKLGLEEVKKELEEELEDGEDGGNGEDRETEKKVEKEEEEKEDGDGEEDGEKKDVEMAEE